MEAQRRAVRDTQLEVFDWGAGEPVVFVQTALTADELWPVADAPPLRDGYRKILYHRRGYAGSSPVDGPGSITRDAADCGALLSGMGVERAHVVGVSYSAAVALQLAVDAPERTRSLTVLEPPPVHTSYGPEFRAASDRFVDVRRAHGPAAALEDFLSSLIGPGWRETVERLLTGAAAQIERDTATFFDTDIPALLSWRFGPADARRITCPVLHIGGTESGPWFAEVRRLVLRWLPHAEDVVIDGADHSLALTHAPEIAEALAAFLRRNPIDGHPRR